MKISDLKEGGKSFHFGRIHFAFRLNEKTRFWMKTKKGRSTFLMGCGLFRLELGIGFSKSSS